MLAVAVAPVRNRQTVSRYGRTAPIASGDTMAVSLRFTAFAVQLSIGIYWLVSAAIGILTLAA